MQMKLFGITDVYFDVIGQRLIRFSISTRHWRKIGSVMVQYTSYLYISRKLVASSLEYAGIQLAQDRAGCCEYGDEPSGSGATELV
jgi:hypothetical protein